MHVFAIEVDLARELTKMRTKLHSDYFHENASFSIIRVRCELYLFNFSLQSTVTN